MGQTRKSKCLLTPRRFRPLWCNHITVSDTFLASRRNLAGNQRIVSKVVGRTNPAIRHWHHSARYYFQTYFGDSYLFILCRRILTSEDKTGARQWRGWLCVDTCSQGRSQLKNVHGGTSRCGGGTSPSKGI
jgi:hypothetical protein